MVFDNLIQRLRDTGSRHVEYALYKLLAPLMQRFQTCVFTVGGFAIKTSSSPIVKTSGGTVFFMADGRFSSLSNNIDMAALSGTVTNGNYNVYVFSINKNNNLFTRMGTEGATMPAVRWPTVPTNEAILGFVRIRPTGTGDFVGGTTALDDATVVPNATYVATVGAFEFNTNHS